MATVNTEEKVLDMLEDICDDDAVREERDIDLFDAGLLDSMAAIELLVAIEEEFGVQIAPTAVDRDEMNTVNKIIHQIEVRLGARARRRGLLRACILLRNVFVRGSSQALALPLLHGLPWCFCLQRYSSGFFSFRPTVRRQHRCIRHSRW